jgi:uncharacterized protein with FMN-binding domain
VKGTRFFLALLALFTLSVFSAVAQVAPRYVDGSYTLRYSDEELGKVTVTVTVKDGAVESVTLPEGKGDVDLDDANLASFLASLVSSGDFMSVDAVSGATQSCDLLKYAVQSALKSATNK